MKLSVLGFIALAAGAAFGSPALEKRASVSDRATIGLATLHGGATGGGSTTPATVTTLAALNRRAETFRAGSNTSIIGRSGAALVGVGINIDTVSNIIIRNLKISRVLATHGDATGVVSSHRVWLDHVDVFSARQDDKDLCDGLIDIGLGSYGVSVMYSYLHDHAKMSLVGGSDSLGSTDRALRVTYAFNKCRNLGSRCPSFRFGKGYFYNNYLTNVETGVNTRVEAELLVQNNVFEAVRVPISSTDNVYLNLSGNDLGGGSYTGPTSTYTRIYP